MSVPPLFEADDLRIAVFSHQRATPIPREDAQQRAGVPRPQKHDLEPDLYEAPALPAGWTEAIHGASIAVRPGETLALVGESASGKSLIVMGALGLLAPGAVLTGGSIRLEGRRMNPLRTPTKRRRRWLRRSAAVPAGMFADEEWRRIVGSRIGVLFQDPIGSWTPDLLIGEQTGEVLAIHTDLTEEEIRERVLDALGEVQLPRVGKSSSYRFELSRGEGQRAMLAAALIKAPDLLVADEPLSGLDPTVASAVLELIRDMVLRRNMAMIFVSHDLAMVASIADKVAVVYGGRVVEEGPADEIYYRPKHPYTEGLLGSIPGLGKGRLRPIRGEAPAITNLPPGCAFAGRCPYAVARCAVDIPSVTVQGPSLVSCHRAAELDLRGVLD